MYIFGLVRHGLLWGLVFGAVFCAGTLLMGRVNAEMLLNDYPPDIRHHFGRMSATARKQANRASLPFLAVLLGVIVLALTQLAPIAGGRTLAGIFISTTVMLQEWNLIDLVVLDWFIMMTLKPGFMILPGTQGMAGYRDYAFHARKFLRGIPLTLVLSAVIALTAWVIQGL